MLVAYVVVVVVLAHVADRKVCLFGGFIVVALELVAPVEVVGAVSAVFDQFFDNFHMVD